MADIALGSVGKIIEVGLAIKEAVETVQQNKEDCHEIQKRVLRVTGILKRLEETKMMDDQAMSGALEDLEETLRQALTLVTACQERHIVCLFCKARDLSKQLRRVQDDIMHKMMLGVFATNVHVTIILTNIEGAPPPTAPQPQNTGASSSETTVESSGRIEMDIKVNKVTQAESDTPFASLHGFTKFSLSELTDATDNFSQDNLIGQGGFSAVYKGTLQDGQVVAIKMYKNAQLFGDKQMATELDILSKVEHRNIVKLLGYVHEVQTTLVEVEKRPIHAEEIHFCLVHEYMPNGDLEKINCGTRANWSSRLQLIQGIALGVNCLHNAEPRIIHLDLKPSNVLLDSNMNAKITDFGISRIIDDADSYEDRTTLIGTLGYMPPEYVMHSLISLKTDVYAFGVILLGTIIGGMCKSDPPSGHAPVEWAREARDKNNRQLRELFDPSLFDESQLKQIKSCLDIGLSCTEMDRYNRPAMADVVDKLDRIKDASGTGSLKNPSLLRRLNTLTSDGRHK